MLGDGRKEGGGGRGEGVMDEKGEGRKKMLGRE